MRAIEPWHEEGVVVIEDLEPFRTRSVTGDEARDNAWCAHKTGSEDDRNNAGAVDLDWQETRAGEGSVDSALSSVLNWNLPF